MGFYIFYMRPSQALASMRSRCGFIGAAQEWTNGIQVRTSIYHSHLGIYLLSALYSDAVYFIDVFVYFSHCPEPTCRAHTYALII